MSESRPSISAFFPCYNDGGTIASMVIEMMRVLRELTDDYEVIVVENGSTDYTNDILDELETLYATDGRLRIRRYKQPLGYGGALRVGFASATKELIFYTDGDAQYDVRELRVLAPRMVDGVDLVMGNKITRHDPLHRIIIGRLYHHLVRLLFSLRIHDTDCDFRLMRRSIFRPRDPDAEQRGHLPGTDASGARRPASPPSKCRSTTITAPTASRSSSTSAASTRSASASSCCGGGWSSRARASERLRSPRSPLQS